MDLLLLHYPSCFPGLAGCDDGVTPEMNWKESWRAMSDLYAQKKVTAGMEVEVAPLLFLHTSIPPYIHTTLGGQREEGTKTEDI